LNKNIGLCYLPTPHAGIGCVIQVLIRGQQVDVVTALTFFYKRPK
jgi:glycine cleavage system aminomethyltransferase T